MPDLGPSEPGFGASAPADILETSRGQRHMGAKRLSFCACAVALLSFVPAEAGNYDGQWTVELSTQQGQCALSYRGTINVAGGRINEGGMFVQAAGLVEPSGK